MLCVAWGRGEERSEGEGGKAAAEREGGGPLTGVGLGIALRENEVRNSYGRTSVRALVFSNCNDNDNDTDIDHYHDHDHDGDP